MHAPPRTCTRMHTHVCTPLEDQRNQSMFSLQEMNSEVPAMPSLNITTIKGSPAPPPDRSPGKGRGSKPRGLCFWSDSSLKTHHRTVGASTPSWDDFGFLLIPQRRRETGLWRHSQTRGGCLEAAGLAPQATESPSWWVWGQRGGVRLSFEGRGPAGWEVGLLSEYHLLPLPHCTEVQGAPLSSYKPDCVS